MFTSKSVTWIAGLSLILASLACTMGAHRPAPIAANGSVAETPTIALAPSLTQTQPAAAEALTRIPAANTSSVPAVTPTPQNPLVTSTAYCWSGPAGTALKYELVSSIQAGTRVQLLGKGIVDGWWVVRNPRYNDPCWIQQQDVQIDPAYDLSTLKTYPIPPTPTATP